MIDDGSIDVQDIETGRVHTAKRSGRNLLSPINTVKPINDENSAANNEISTELQSEVDRQNYLRMLEEARTNSKNIAESLRLKQQAAEASNGYTLFDFMDIANVKRCKFDDIDYAKLKKLYMIKTKNVNSLLFLSQTKMSELFDRFEYTSIMKSIYNCVYILPLSDPLVKDESKSDDSNTLSDYPMDELFMWSLLLYGGKDEEFDLIKYYWSLTSKPIACAFAAILVFTRFQKKSFVSEELKAKLEKLNIEFENYAYGLFDVCYEEKQDESEDLILNEIPIFYNRTALDMSIEAQAREFIKHKGIQQLLTDIWWEKINFEISKWKIFFSCVFIPFTLIPVKIFRTDYFEESNIDEDAVQYEDSAKALMAQEALPPNVPNDDLPFRCDDDAPMWLARPFLFLSAPIIKFIHHMVYHMLFVLLFAYFMLFEYYPAYTLVKGDRELRFEMDIGYFRFNYFDLTIVIWNTLFLIEFLRQMFLGEAFDLKLTTKIKNHFSQDPWNILDVIIFGVFYAGVGFKYYPSIRDTCLAWDESCVELGRVFYSIAMTLAFLKTLRYLAVLPEWGPKLFMIKEMIKQLVIFVILLGLIIVPYSVTFQTITKGSLPYKTRVMSGSFNFILWPIFGNLQDVLKAIQDYECPPTLTTCKYGLRSTYLYISFGIYMVVCNLLIFNMIISVFCSKVSTIKEETQKAFGFKRYSFIKEYSRKTIFPAPLALIEYLVRLFMVLVNLCNGETFTEFNSFAIKDCDDVVEREYIRFEGECRKKYFMKPGQIVSNNVEISGAGSENPAVSKGGFAKVFESVEKSSNKSQFEKHFKHLENKLNAMQAVIEKINKKTAHSGQSGSMNSMESLKSSIDYLTHYLITSNVDIMEKEARLAKAS